MFLVLLWSINFHAFARHPILPFSSLLFSIMICRRPLLCRRRLLYPPPVANDLRQIFYECELHRKNSWKMALGWICSKRDFICSKWWNFSLTVFTFDNVESAVRAKDTLNGADIYSGCCTLKIDFAKVSTFIVFKFPDVATITCSRFESKRLRFAGDRTRSVRLVIGAFSSGCAFGKYTWTVIK